MSKRFGLLFLVAFLVMPLAGCRNNRSPQPQRVVHSVAVIPYEVSVARGAGYQFEANVSVSGGASTAVTWSVEGLDGIGAPIEVHDYTDIDDGYLTVAPGEAATTLRVIATSNHNPGVYGYATVTLTGDRPVTITGVTVHGPASIEAGSSTQPGDFHATVQGTNTEDEAVTWSIYETGRASGTFINAGSGVLTVSITEALTSLTIRATSVTAPAIFGQTTIAVDPPADGLHVAISPRDISAGRGARVPFTATVTVIPTGAGIPTAVTWDVDGDNPGTRIEYDPNDSHSATLVVAANQAIGPITVTVRSTHDPYEYDFATVDVTGDEAVNYVWLVGSMVYGGWDNFPGTPMVRDAEAGTFRWSGAVAARATFRFNLSYATTGWANGSWFAPYANDTYVVIGRNYKTRFDNPDGPSRAWRIQDAGYYAIIVDPVAKTMYVEREGIPVDAVWLVGHMAEDGWNLPGEPMARNTADGTFTWAGYATASNYFRFNLDIGTTGWGAGTWFAPPGGNTDAVLGISGMARRVNPTIGTGDAWRITQPGWYVFTVCPRTETLHVARPVIVDSITIVSPPVQLFPGAYYDFAATLTGRNVDDVTVVWTVAGGGEGTGFGTGAYANRLTIAANDAGETLTITASANGQTAQITRVVVDPASLGDAVINLVIEDRGEGLAIVGGIPSEEPRISAGGALPYSVTFTIYGASNPDRTYEWIVSGVRKEGPSVTLYAANFGIGRHTVRLIVTDENGVVWSMPQLLHFTVVQ